MDDSVETLRTKARLTTWLVEMRRQGEEWPFVTTSEIEQATIARDLPADERANRLLRGLVNNTGHLGAQLEGDALGLPALAAEAECINMDELIHLIRYLENRGDVEANIIETFGGTHFYGVVVTTDGHTRVADATQAADPSQAFVAMWFSPDVDGLYESGIQPGIKAAGYKALRIDKKEDADKIDDAIIAEIRRSRFVVADFTHGDEGARGGVYYEAGFAHGLNIPVVFTCRADMISKIHFDTRQYNHITWKEPGDLVEPLRNRILARFGEGPNRQ